MYKILAIAALTSFVSYSATAQEAAPQEDVCAKLVRLEAIKGGELGKCRKASKDPEFKRKSCNRRPDQGFCKVKFASENLVKPIKF